MADRLVVEVDAYGREEVSKRSVQDAQLVGRAVGAAECDCVLYLLTTFHDVPSSAPMQCAMLKSVLSASTFLAESDVCGRGSYASSVGAKESAPCASRSSCRARGGRA
eukprot:scaffold186388_cov29-Tisochrysis_lutea.AAC.5